MKLNNSDADKFFVLSGGTRNSHLCLSTELKSVCGRRSLSFKKTVEIKFINGELVEKWGDGKLQEFKWVKVDDYRYCKKCLNKLAKNKSSNIV